MKRFTALLLAGALLLATAGCTPQEAETTPTPEAKADWTPGTYTGTAAGMWGDVTVEVTLDDKAITGVALTEHGETKHIAQAAIDEMSQRMVEEQTYKVDAATGATVTSLGIRMAAQKALESAGALEAFSGEPAAKERTQGEAESYDLVIVGGGGSGLTAAAYASAAGVKSVLVLEKMSWAGGSTSVSGGGSIVGGSRYNELAGVDYSTKEYLDFFKNAAEHAENRPEDMWINEALVEKIGANAGETFDTFMDNGFPLPEKFWENPANTTLWAEWGKEGRGLLCFTGNSSDLYNGWLPKYAEGKGAEIRLNSAVTELIVENGAVTGVKVEGPDSTYTVNAKKVILACGGMEANAELVAQYAPEASGMGIYAAAGNTGDFIALTEELSPSITGYGSVGQAGPYRGRAGAGASMMGLSLMVNSEGDRFTNEDIKYYYRARKVNAQPGNFAWGVADSNNPFVPSLEEDLKAGVGFKADTLEELAEKMEVPVEKLLAAQAEVHAEYEADPDPLNRPLGACAKYDVSQGPFYAQKIYPLLMFTLTGLELDKNCRVINDNGETIPNLYAVGEIAFGNCFFDEYVCGGCAIQIAVNTGRIAGETVAQEILSQ